MNLTFNLNLIFLKWMNLNLKIKTKMNGSNQCRRYSEEKGEQEPLTAACTSHFGLLKILLLETSCNDKTTMMEKE